MIRTVAFAVAAPLSSFLTASALSLHRCSTFPALPARISSSTTRRQQPTAMFGFLKNVMTDSAQKKAATDMHTVLGNPLQPEIQPPFEQATFGLGCFWGAEKKFWQVDGVYTTSVGYAGGHTKNPKYRAVCSGTTNHAEVVNVVYDTTKTSYDKLLDVFWDAHDPTTKNRQGNDVGTQYRSVIFYYNDEQKKAAESTMQHFNSILTADGRKACSTEISPAPEYYIAEDYHQQYLDKNPWGYCGLGGTGLYRPQENKN